MIKYMHEKIICAGFGGQGIMLMGKLLAYAGMKSGYHVSWMPSYGAEVRGGTAHSMVHISTRPIAAPVISEPTACVVMNQPSLDKFMGRMKKNGLLIVNTSMAGEIVEKKALKVVALPLTDLASELGSARCANMIAVGVFARLGKVFSLGTVLESLEEIFSAQKGMIEINRKALKKGYDLVKRDPMLTHGEYSL